MAYKTSDVSKEEKEFRSKIYKDVDEIVNKKPTCTSCQEPVTELIVNGIPQIHPILKTLFCWKCSHFYGNGDFSGDEEGGEKYCKWCGQGGTLYLCSSCPAGFCKKCIRRNLPRSVLDDVEKDSWKCFCCHVDPLYELRAQAWAAERYARIVKKEDREADRDYKAMKGERVEKARFMRRGTRKVKPTAEKKTLELAFHKYAEYLGSIQVMCDTIKKKCGDMKSDKLNRRAVELYSEDSVGKIHDKVLSILSNGQQTFQELTDKCERYLEQWKVSLESAKKQDKEEEKKKPEKKTARGSDSEDEPTPSRGRGRSRKAEQDSEEESENELPSKRSRKSAKESDESEEETTSRSKKPTKVVEKETTPLKKRSKFRRGNDSHDESEDESESLKKSKKGAGRETPKRTTRNDDSEIESSPRKNGRSKKTQDSDMESEDESGSKKTSKKGTGRETPKRKTRNDDSETESSPRKNGRSRKTQDSDMEEEEEAQPKRSSRAKKTGKAKYTKDSDSSQEDD